MWRGERERGGRSTCLLCSAVWLVGFLEKICDIKMPYALEKNNHEAHIKQYKD